MAVRIVKSERDEPSDPVTKLAFIRWVLGKIKMDEGKTDQARVRETIIGAFDQVPPDADGHRLIVFDEPIEGYGSIQYQRRVTTVPNVERALEILEENGLLEECTVQVRQIDEESLMRAVYDGRLEDSQLSEMYPQKETFAVVVKRA